MRRALLVPAFLVVALLSAGCVPSLIERQAQWARVNDPAMTLVWKDTLHEEGETEAAGRQVRYKVDSRASAWINGEDLGVAVLTTPSVSLFGMEFNPVSRMSPRDMLDRVIETARDQLGEHIEMPEGLDPQIEEAESVYLESSLGALSGSRFLVRVEGYEALAVVVRGKHGPDLVVVGAVLPSKQQEAWDALVRSLGKLEHPREPGPVSSVSASGTARQ